MNKYIDKVTGPVIPLPTPFNSKFEVDYGALSSYVKFLVDNGIRNVMTTVGTSRFNLLTEDEVKKVNETVVKAAAGKAITIVANPLTGGTDKAIEFGKHAEQIGADLFLTYYPERYYGDDNTYDYLKAINDAVNIGILIHEMPMRNGYGPGNIQYSLPLLHRLLELKNIVGVKEEALDAEYSNKIVAEIKDKAVVIGAGGGMSRYYLRDHKLGSKAFLGGIGNFIPQLELEFYNAMMNGDQERAGKIVNEIEIPYFTKVVPVGWHPSLKAALALKGLMPAHERPPMKQYTAEETNVVKEAMKSNNWI
ncbi:MAG TPA: dihydrodipicolinate synthase family protein [Bacteroidia bacterium]|jgi:dihydrodipicolinate synthase/N-acetylneuraminate lyase|nr:dihydrodipicolinate synthase family protein [Bacteroidia bacterium]